MQAPEPLSQTPAVQAPSRPEQSNAVPVHTPLSQKLFTVQGSPSSHGVPLGCPLHGPAQLGSDVPAQTPAVQESALVQESPSSQTPPSFLAEARQEPVAGLH